MVSKSFRSSRSRRPIMTAALAAVSVSVATPFLDNRPAHALVINATFDSTFMTDPNASYFKADVNNAITAIEGYIANPVTVNIDFADMATGLGPNTTKWSYLGYSNYLSDLQNNQTLSTYDNTALASLPGSNPVPGNTSSQILTTLPLLRAIGESASNGGTFDSTISLDLGLMNLNRTSSQNPTKYDAQSVAAHEIDEVLGIGGYGSELSIYTWQDKSNPVGPLDLFRYSAPGIRSYDPSVNVASYFSIDGGMTNLVNFNQSGFGRSDFADWGNGATPQVQDAYGTPGAEPNLGSNELAALDVVGWNLTPAGLAVESQNAVPEPTSLSLLALAGAGMLLLKRRGCAARVH